MQQQLQDLKDFQEALFLIRHTDDGYISIGGTQGIFALNTDLRDITSTVSEQLQHLTFIPKVFFRGVQTGDFLCIRGESDRIYNLYQTVQSALPETPHLWEIQGKAEIAEKSQKLYARSVLKPTRMLLWDGGSQFGIVNKDLKEKLRIRIYNQANFGIEGITVNVSAPSGRFRRTDGITDREGFVEFEYTCGETAGEVTFTFTTAGLPNLTATLTVEAVHPDLRILTGDGQVGRTLETLRLQLRVILRDQDGSAIDNARITWEVVQGALQVLAGESVTTAWGVTGVQVVLPSLPEEGKVRASYGGNSVEFTVTTVLREPTTFRVLTGDSQIGFVNSVLPSRIIARLLDQDGDGLSETGVSVVHGVNDKHIGSLVNPNLITDERGIVELYWRLGADVGDYSLQLSAVDASVILSATAETAPEAIYTLRKIIGDTQTGYVNETLENLLIVQLLTNNEPVANEVVKFLLLQDTGDLSVTEDLTNSQGYAETRLTLGTTARQYQVRASYTAGETVYSQVFTATAEDIPVDAVTAGIAIIAGEGQVGLVERELPNPLIVRITDQYGNGLPNLPVAFSDFGHVPGLVFNTEVLTNGAGFAQTRYRLGETVGDHSIRASLNGPTGLPRVEFDADSIAEILTMTNLYGSGQSIEASGTLPVPLTVQIPGPVR